MVPVQTVQHRFRHWQFSACVGHRSLGALLSAGRTLAATAWPRWDRLEASASGVLRAAARASRTQSGFAHWTVCARSRSDWRALDSMVIDSMAHESMAPGSMRARLRARDWEIAKSAGPWLSPLTTT